MPEPREAATGTVAEFPDVSAELVKSWGNRWPNANIGALMGRGIVALDIDPRNGDWETLSDIGVGRPATATTLTGGGGEHWFFKTNSDCASSSLGPGLEIKGEGTLVVLPPSLHPSGRRYEWEAGFALGKLAPVLLPDALRVHPARSGASGARRGQTVTGSPELRRELEGALLARGGETQRDGRVLCSCPFPGHDDDTPSFFYSAATGRWWCFGAEHPGRRPSATCASGTAWELRKALDDLAHEEMLISVIEATFSCYDYRNQHRATLEQTCGVYQRRIETLETRIKGSRGANLDEMENIARLRSLANSLGDAIETWKRTPDPAPSSGAATTMRRGPDTLTFSFAVAAIPNAPSIPIAKLGKTCGLRRKGWGTLESPPWCCSAAGTDPAMPMRG